MTQRRALSVVRPGGLANGADVDQVATRRSVGSTTFSRGASYAVSGAVASGEWDHDGARVAGQVWGSGREPYAAVVQVHRSRDGRVTGIDGLCTCPVAVDCKHAVALVLGVACPDPPGHPAAPQRPAGAARVEPVRALAPAVGATLKEPPGEAIGASWEVALRELLGGGRRGEPAPADMGLQFELVLPPATHVRAQAATRILLRPVVPGRSANWVRSGVSWSRLPYAAGPDAQRRVALLAELVQLSTRRGRSGIYRYGAPDVVALDDIPSRRLWDLLSELRASGVPLLDGHGRTPRPVTLRSDLATVALSASRDEEGLVLAPMISVGEEAASPGASLLIGQPAHGIAWWDLPPGAPASGARLSLAALRDPLSESVLGLLRGPALRVPASDEDRFVTDALPVLRRSVVVRSGDATVQLPEEEPPVLVLTVGAAGVHRIAVDWAWVDRNGGGEDRRGLGGGDSGADGGRPREPVGAAKRAVAGVAELWEATPFGPALRPAATLEGMAAVSFLDELVPRLEVVPGLEVDIDPAVMRYREAVSDPQIVLSGDPTDGGDWFDLQVNVTIDGEEVPFADLFVAVAESQTHLILPSGTYFALDTPELRALAELVAEARTLQESAGSTVRVGRFQAALWDELAQLGVLAGRARQWEESVRALLDAAGQTEIPLPEELDATLRPYQVTGFNWLAYLYDHRLGGILADDMGLGKTVQILALVCRVAERRPGGPPWLVVAPTSVVGNWVAECERFAPGLRAVAVTATQARRAHSLADLADGADLVVTSYSLLRLEVGQYEEIEWAGLVLDEAQFAKNHSSHTYRSVAAIPVPFKVAVTGTPMENHLMELWSMLSITAPGLFPSAKRFGQDYRLPIERHGDTGQLDQLRRRIAPLVLRRTKGQVAADLPAKQEQVLELELEPKHRRAYQRHLQRERQKVLGLLADLDGNRFEILRSLTLLRQASLAPWLVDPSATAVPSTKLDAVTEMLDEIVGEGHRVLVFSQFTRFLDAVRVRVAAAGIDHCYLDGRTRRRPEVIARFRDDKVPVFLISLKAGGFGLNLTEADHCILLDPWWNPATEAQAVDRVHRIGQDKKVMIYRLVAKGTIEEKVMALKQKKAALFASVVDAGGFESGVLGAEDIRALLG